MYFYNLYVKPNGIYVLKKVKNRFAYVSYDWLLIDTFIYNEALNTFQSYFVYIETIRSHNVNFFKNIINYIYNL